MKRSVAVIGSNAEALVAAALLAREGHAITVIANAPPAALELPDAGWIDPRVLRALDLARRGLQVHAAHPWLTINLPEGDVLELTHDVRASAEAIRAKLSARDADAWPGFCARLYALSRLLGTLYSAPPPDPLAANLRGRLTLARSALRVRALGRQGLEDLLRMVPMSAADLLDDWFESDLLKGALGGLAITHLAQGPRSGGTAFNLLHHLVGSRQGVFAQPLSNAGAVLTTMASPWLRNGSVARIDIEKNRVTGVHLDDGAHVQADLVVSGLSPARTLIDLIDPAWLDPELVRGIRNVRSRGVTAILLLTLDRQPRFERCVVAASLDHLERGWDDAKHGHVSRAPYLEARYGGDAGNGRHHLHVHVQYVPYASAAGVWETQQSDAFARSVIAQLSMHVPGLADWVIGQRVLTPADLEHIHGWPQGQPYHAELALDQALWMRPVPALAQYRTPVRGLYLCGPAMHPGGGWLGAAGVNAVQIVCRDAAG